MTLNTGSGFGLAAVGCAADGPVVPEISSFAAQTGDQ